MPEQDRTIRYGNYTIVKMIGSGGFADVYLGEHIYLKTYAAIKVLRTTLEEEDLHLFLTEAQMVAKLKHPHIVRVLEFGQEQQVPYLVMDYATRGTLRQHHPRGTRLSPELCAEYVQQLASAIQYAHDRKVVHRDIKPENILVEQDGQVLLSDFGIAILSPSSHYADNQDIGGTVLYMAPEQLQGAAIPASDQYALGVVAYELLTGQPPFNGSLAEVAAQHCVAPVPSLRTKIPTLPKRVNEVIQRSLAKDPQQRFACITDFSIALEQAVHQSPSSLLTSLPPLPISHPWNELSAYLKYSALNGSRQIWSRLLLILLLAQTITRRGNSLLKQWSDHLPQWTWQQTAPSLTHGYRKLLGRSDWLRSRSYPISGALTLILLVSALSWLTFKPELHFHQHALSWGHSSAIGTPRPSPTHRPVKHHKPSPTPVRPAQANVSTWNRAITTNRLFSCNGCNAPLIVTLTTISTSSHGNTMSWQISISNTGETNAFVSIISAHLQGGNSNGVQANFDRVPRYLAPGENENQQFLFPVTPIYGNSYTLQLQIVVDQLYIYEVNAVF